MAKRTASRPRCTGAILGAAAGRAAAAGVAAAFCGWAVAAVRCTPPAVGCAGFVGQVPILGPVAAAFVAAVVVVAAVAR